MTMTDPLTGMTAQGRTLLKLRGFSARLQAARQAGDVGIEQAVIAEARQFFADRAAFKARINAAAAYADAGTDRFGCPLRRGLRDWNARYFAHLEVTQ